MSRSRRYHVAPLRRWLLWLAIGPMLGMLIALALSGDAAERPALLLTAGLVFLIVLPFHFIVDRTLLVLCPSGLRLRQTGYQLAARWDEIERLLLAPGREGFVTRAPMTGKGAARLARFRLTGAPYAPLYDAERRRLLAERRLIPIEAFAWHLRHGDMSRVIARFAPHLAKALDVH